MGSWCSRVLALGGQPAKFYLPVSGTVSGENRERPSQQGRSGDDAMATLCWMTETRDLPRSFPRPGHLADGQVPPKGMQTEPMKSRRGKPTSLSLRPYLRLPQCELLALPQEKTKGAMPWRKQTPGLAE